MVKSALLSELWAFHGFDFEAVLWDDLVIISKARSLVDFIVKRSIFDCLIDSICQFIFAS